MERLIQSSKIKLTQLSSSMTDLTQTYLQPFETDNITAKVPNRTTSSIISQIVLLLFIMFNISNSQNTALETTTVNIALFCINLFIFIFYRFLNPKMLKMYYNCFIVLYGPFVLYNLPQNPSIELLIIQLFPLLGLALTHCRTSFILLSFVQMAYLHCNQSFSLQLTKAAIELSPQVFSQQIIDGLKFLILARIVLILLISDSSEELAKKIACREQEGKDVQRQKEFLLGFSHEFRNLTHSIVGNIKLANLEDLPRKVQTLLVRAEISAELLLQHINNILDSGKLEVNELEITPSRTRIHDILEQVWRVSSEMLKFKGLTGSIKVSKHVPNILYIDHYRILQILFNLISNAVKYTTKGSVTVIIDWIDKNETVDDSCFEPVPFNDTNEYDEGLFEKRQAFSVFDESLHVLDFNNKRINNSREFDEKNNSVRNGILKVTVTDSGCGIIASNIPKLWDIFWKPVEGTSGRKYGTGLGLFITKHLCRSMKGDIQVYTRAGKGSSFVFCVPTKSMVAQTQSEASFEMRQGIIQGKGLKAMVVDDVLFNNLILRNFLEKMEIEVVHMAEDGIDAFSNFVKQVNSQQPLQIITMDIDMPRMDGKRAARKIREYEVTHNLKPCILIMVSGDCSESDIKECTAKNGQIRADGFIKKPASMEELEKVIANALI